MIAEYVFSKDVMFEKYCKEGNKKEPRITVKVES